MSDQREDVDSLPLSALQRVDQVADRFEAAWQEALATEGEGPLIEDYLKGGAGAERTALLRALLRLDCGYQNKRDRRPDQAVYRERFPNDEEIIESETC